MAEGRKKKKRWISGFLALLTAFSVLPCRAGTVRAEEPTEPVDEVQMEATALEGIRLDKTSLVMRTGDQKELTLSLLPEDYTGEVEIQWSSDDPEVARVAGDGCNAVVTAPEGEGGTAVITASAGTYTAACRVLVTVQEPMLESVIFMQNSSGSNRYELTEGTPGSREYTLRIPENTNVVYIRPQLRDDLSEAAEITARFTDAGTGEERSVTLPVDESTSLSGETGRLIKAYDTEPRELELEVRDGERTETWQIHVVRGTYLGGFTLTDAAGDSLAYTPQFKKTVYQYSIHVPASTGEVSLKLTPAEESSTSLTVNGETAEDGSYTLPLAGEKVTAVMRAGDGVSVPYAYTLTLYVDEVCYLKVSTEPADAVFVVYNSEQEQLTAKDGRYELIRGNTYTYTVSARGYRSESGSFKANGDQELKLSLQRSADSTLEELEAEWGGYWKTEENQNITTSPGPISAENTELAWKQQYGVSGDDNNRVSDGILVEDYLCCFQGRTLMYLDKQTGACVKSVQMTTPGNSAFNKPLYAAGMIFVPLNNGRVQAFNAKTLESLWIYTDTVGGGVGTALRYDDGYLYVGFTDGNLVCLSAADEEPDKTDEKKAAVWRKYDSGGFYRTGVYTGDTYLYACSSSGAVYCLDKRTGETVQKLALPAEAGAASTAVCYADGNLYFATEKGYLYSIGLTEDEKLDTGRMNRLDLNGTVYGTPLVYGGRIYVGSAAMDSYGTVHSPYYLNVVQEAEDGQLSLAYRMELAACPKSTATLTTAGETAGGVRVYLTTDSPSGSIYLLRDQPGLTAPGEGSGLLYQQSGVPCNGGGTVLLDRGGWLYLRYESGWLLALKPTELYLRSAELSGEHVVWDGGQAFDGQMEEHTVLLDGGVDQVRLSLTASTGAAVWINGQEGDSRDISLKDGRAEVTVLLKKGEQTRTYRIRIRQRSSDASLDRLQVSYSPVLSVMELELEPAFEPERTSYQASIYGTGKADSFYVWPMLADTSENTMKVTAVSGISGMSAGQELEPMTVQIAGEKRQRYQVKPAGTEPAVVQITVTAEDGKTTRAYRVVMGRNNDAPKITEATVVSRDKASATIRIRANLDGYLYYLTEKKAESAGMPTASAIRTRGERTAVQAGVNEVQIDGVDPEESVLYLYEMSYAQRFSSGVQLDVAAYTGELKPGSRGDINGDGQVNIADVCRLLDAITAGQSLSTETADVNGDGRINIADVTMLLDLVTSGG